MSFFSPIFRSRRFGHRLLAAQKVVLIGVITWLAPTLIGGLIFALALYGYEPNNFDNPWTVVSTIGGMMLLAPLAGIMLVPLALLVGAWAMRFGVAGWATALIVAFLAPLGIGFLMQWSDPTSGAIDAMFVFVPVSLVHGAIMWIATRWLCPEALIAPSS